MLMLGRKGTFTVNSHTICILPTSFSVRSTLFHVFQICHSFQMRDSIAKPGRAPIAPTFQSKAEDARFALTRNCALFYQHVLNKQTSLRVFTLSEQQNADFRVFQAITRSRFSFMHSAKPIGVFPLVPRRPGAAGLVGAGSGCFAARSPLLT